MSTITRSASVVTIRFASVEELSVKLDSLRKQLGKLPALQSGKKRSFSRKGLVLEVPVPVWDELASLQTREAATAQLVSEIAGPINTPVDSPALQEAVKSLQELATLRLPEEPGDDEPTPDLSKCSVKQLKELCISKGLRYPCRATKSLLISILTK